MRIPPASQANLTSHSSAPGNLLDMYIRAGAFSIQEQAAL
jgi:hypothetical protein